MTRIFFGQNKKRTQGDEMNDYYKRNQFPLLKKYLIACAYIQDCENYQKGCNDCNRNSMAQLAQGKGEHA